MNSKRNGLDFLLQNIEKFHRFIKYLKNTTENVQKKEKIMNLIQLIVVHSLMEEAVSNEIRKKNLFF